MRSPRQYTATTFPIGVVVFGAACALLLAPGEAAAELIVIVDDVTATAGQPGFLDVSFDVADQSPSLAGYQIELTVTGPDSGVRFTGFAEPADAVFPGQSARKLDGLELPGNTVAVYDYLCCGEKPINDGSRLLRLLFETDPGILDTYTVTVNPSPLRTAFSDGSGALLPIDQFVAGSITVVPEPSAAILFFSLFGLMISVHCRNCWSRTSRPTVTVHGERSRF